MHARSGAGRCLDVPHPAIDTPADGPEDAFSARTGGGAAERAGLENRYTPQGDGTTTPSDKGTCDDNEAATIDALARRLRKDADLVTVVEVWQLLDEPIRQAIIQLVRVKSRD